MPRTKISEFSATPANNTDIDSINISEGCAPSGINDAIRELMAQLKDFQTGAVGDSFNGPVGTSTAAAGAFTTLSASSTVTLSGGTANGVAYLNGSKVVTSGSALTFDGTNLTLGGVGPLFIADMTNATRNSRFAFQTSTANSATQVEAIPNGTAPTSGFIVFNNSDRTNASSGLFRANATEISIFSNITGTGTYLPLTIYTGGSERLRVDTSGNLGIGTSSPAYKLDVVGTAGISGILTSTVTNGQVVAAGSGNTSGIYSNFANTGGTLQYGIDNSTGSYIYSGSSNYAGFIGTTGATSLVLATNSVVRATIDSSGNLGLGVTPSAWGSTRALQVNRVAVASVGGTGKFATNWYNDGTDRYLTTDFASLYQQNDGQHRFYTAPSGTAGNAITFTQAMTLTAAGNLGIGTTSPTERLVVSGPSTDGTVISVIGNSTYGTKMFFGQAGISNRFWGMPAGQDAFVWTGFNSGAYSEQMRLDASGNLLVGCTALGATGGFGVGPNSGSSFIDICHVTGTASGTAYARFFFNSSQIGSITQSGTTAVLYNLTSDQRLKENIQDAESSSNLIDSIQVRKFDWKTDQTHQRYGFIAQELVTVYPEAVHQPADSEEMMAVDYSKLVPMLVKEIQSLRKRLADAGIA